jgi:hypothetical protein
MTMFYQKLTLACLPAAWYWVFILIKAIWRDEARTNLALANLGGLAALAAAISPLTSIMAVVIVWRAWHRLSDQGRAIATAAIMLSFAAGARFWLGLSLSMRG